VAFLFSALPFLGTFFRSPGPLQEFTRVEDRVEGPNRKRQYQAHHAQDRVAWDFSLDSDGKTLGFGPK
jgi:hypothetical protein